MEINIWHVKENTYISAFIVAWYAIWAVIVVLCVTGYIDPTIGICT